MSSEAATYLLNVLGNSTDGAIADDQVERSADSETKPPLSSCPKTIEKAGYLVDSLASSGEADLRTVESSADAISAESTGLLHIVEVSDESLLAQIQEGNHGALALLFRRYARMVRSVADRIVRDGAEAEDLVQEVFLFVFRKASLFDPARGSARSWIVQVTYHRAIDRRRHLASRHFYRSAELDETLLTIEEPKMETAFFERSVEGSLGTEMLKRIEEALSNDQLRTIQLYFFGGYSFEEIAGLTGQTVGNARNHYYRGLERIRTLVFASGLRAK